MSAGKASCGIARSVQCATTSGMAQLIHGLRISGTRNHLKHYVGNMLSVPNRAASSTAVHHAFETLKVIDHSGGVIEVQLNRPSKANAMNKSMWRELRHCFDSGLDSTVDALSSSTGAHPRIDLAATRAVLLTAAGANFTSGLDLQDHVDVLGGGAVGKEAAGSVDAARRMFALKRMIASYQASITSLEACPCPVIAVIHGACVGGGVDLVAAADIRVASSDAWMCVKEVDLGLAADVGTLQRLPRIVGNESLARELIYTARRFTAAEALSFGAVSSVLPDKQGAFDHAMSIARSIASKSPVAVQGSKAALLFSRDHPVSSGLAYQQAWNAGALQTSDISEAAMAAMQKREARFPDMQ